MGLSPRGIQELLKDLKKDHPVHLLIAPAALKLLDKLPQVLGFFRSLGVRSFHQVLPYADITLWAYSKFLSENPGGSFICSACVGIREGLQRNNLDRFLIPVYSPLLCGAKYLRRYRGLEGGFAFLSPCNLKEKEFVLPNGEELVSYNITIKALKEFLAHREDELSCYPPLLPEKDPLCPGLTLGLSNTISGSLSCLFPEKKFEIRQGPAEIRAGLTRQGMPADTVLEAYACRGGCSFGSGTGRAPQKAEPGICLSGTEFPGAADAVSKLFKHFDQVLNLSDFCFSPQRPVEYPAAAAALGLRMKAISSASRE
jgi:hypothetical protein